VTQYIKCSSCGSINRASDRKGKKAVCGKCKTTLDFSGATSDQPIPVTDATFDHEVLIARIPVLVDFFATWCGACRSLEPSLDAMALRYKGKVKVAKIDVGQNPQYANRYQIKATPTLIVFQAGQLVEKVEGALPEQALERLLQKYAA